MGKGNSSSAGKAGSSHSWDLSTLGDAISQRWHALLSQVETKTPNPPVIRRITELNSNDHLIRQSNRAKLDPDSIEACKECPKPVWFTAFFDGTGNNYYKDGNDKNTPDPDTTNYSNIAKLWQFGHGEKPLSDYPRSTARYVEGVGTPCRKPGFVDDSGEGVDNALGMADALYGEGRILWILDELKKHVNYVNKGGIAFVSQINLAVFGFSRGATEARAFVHMLTSEKLAMEVDGKLYWRKPNLEIERVPDKIDKDWHWKKPTWLQQNISGKPIEIVIYFMGLLDTVASVGWGGSRTEDEKAYYVTGAGVLAFGVAGIVVGSVGAGTLQAINEGGHAAWAKDLSIPGYVRKCVQYVASHEVREKFPSDSLRVDQALPYNCTEVFYPGVHSDVGGGYKRLDCQEGRTNEFGNIPLNNMFIEAWHAGVPLKDPKDIKEMALFEISHELEQCWNVYMGQGNARSHGSAPSSDKLEDNIVWHMNRYYHWRASRYRRLRDGRLNVEKTDDHMKITDKEWAEDVETIASVETGWFKYYRALLAHEQAIYDSYKGYWIKRLDARALHQFSQFFDFYIHDSIAYFKKQMEDGHVDWAEESRWSINRRYFVGRRGDDYIFWCYQGKDPVHAAAELAMQDSHYSTNGDIQMAAAAGQGSGKTAG